jgi:hypothetical protein
VRQFLRDKSAGEVVLRSRVHLVTIFESANSDSEVRGGRALIKFRGWNSAASGSLGAENVDTVGVRSVVLFGGNFEGGRR